MLNIDRQTLLVMAPHPDDEVLGCGGLIKRIKDNGGKVYVVFLTVGNTKDYSKSGSSTIQERIKEIEKVAKFLKYDDYKIVFPGDEFHLKLDQMPKKDLISEIENGQRISLNKIKVLSAIYDAVSILLWQLPNIMITTKTIAHVHRRCLPQHVHCLMN